MMSLFSPFDLKLWLCPTAILLVSISNLLSSSWMIGMLNSLFKFLKLFVLSLVSSTKPKSIGKMYFSFPLVMLVHIFLLNFISIMPFNFSFTSNLGMVMALSLSFWVSLIMFSLTNNIKGLLSHCIPDGTPIPLTFFLFLIEIVSNVIRPITLTVRLVANILAGHLLMILLSELALQYVSFSIFYLLLNMVELAVALIQSYIFITMTTLYYSDVS